MILTASSLIEGLSFAVLLRYGRILLSRGLRFALCLVLGRLRRFGLLILRSRISRISRISRCRICLIVIVGSRLVSAQLTRLIIGLVVHRLDFRDGRDHRQ